MGGTIVAPMPAPLRPTSPRRLQATLLTALTLLSAPAGAQEGEQADRELRSWGWSQDKHKHHDHHQHDLELGELAPDLSGLQVLRPAPIRIEQTDETRAPIRVVHFLTGGCEGCARDTVRFNAVQSLYAARGVEVLGVLTTEPDTSQESTLAALRDWGSRATYSMLQDPGGTQTRSWHADHITHGSPYSFVIDRDGRLAYRGRAMWLEAPLRGLLAGDWDPSTGREQVERAFHAFKAIYRASGDSPDRVVTMVSEFRLDHPLLASEVDQLEFEALLELDRGREAAHVGRRMLAAGILRRDPIGLNDLAWALVDPHRQLEHRDLGLAMSAARKAADLTDELDPYILDTLARVHAWRGEIEAAMALQQRAVELSDETLLREALDEYRSLADSR